MSKDLIDRVALRKTFENACIYGLPMNELYGAILKIIDNAPAIEYPFYQEAYQTGFEEGKNARPQGEWIPVSERLPEENGEYLVTREAYIDRENRNMIFVMDIARFTINHGLNNGFHKVNTVIAWQPLPEPYKKGGAE